jgi:drug/metabolite transporter (DMT)-like permease
VFVHFAFLGPLFFFVTLIPGAGAVANDGLQLSPRVLPWLLVFALGWMLPVVSLTIYGASHIDPGRFAILLMLEIVVGLTTAWLLTDEPLGARELVGAALVLGAIGVEMQPAPRDPAASGRGS